MNITLDHHTHDRLLPRLNLLRQLCRHLRLVPMVLQRVTVTTIHHQPLPQVLLLQRRLRRRDARPVVVRPPLAAPQDHEAVLVAYRADDGNDARFRHGQEVVRVLDSVNRYV